MVGMFPFGDPVSSRLYTDLQRAVYSELVKLDD